MKAQELYSKRYGNTMNFGKKHSSFDMIEFAEEYAQELVNKNDLLADVSQQRELLLAFKEWYAKHTIAQPIHSKNIENFIKANNSG